MVMFAVIVEAAADGRGGEVVEAARGGRAVEAAR